MEWSRLLSRPAPHLLAKDVKVIQKMFCKFHRCFLTKPRVFLTVYPNPYRANFGAPIIIEQPLTRVKLSNLSVTGSPSHLCYNDAMSEESRPLLVGFVADLMFNVRITNVAEQLGFETQWIENAGDLAPAESDGPPPRPGELVHGQGGVLFEKLANWQPDLLIFDLGNDNVPWREWIAAIKSSPATRRIPVLCYGPHVDVETMEAARDLGADAVVARSRFTSAMSDLIQKHARDRDEPALTSACSEPLAELARQGIEEFNAGHFYDAHDYLEEAWVEDQGAGRNLYRGILQVGIAYYQIERGNYRGAVKMLLRVRQWLNPLPAVCRGVDVARLRQDVESVHSALVERGPEQMERLDRNLFRPVRLIDDQ